MITLTAKIISVVSAVFMLLNPFASFLRRTENAPTQKAHEVTYELFDYDEVMAVHKKSQKNYLAAIHETKKQKYNGKIEVSRPEPAYLAWNTTVDETETDFDAYTVYFSRNADMSDAEIYETTDTEIKIYNVLVGETYYWCVEAEYDGDTYRSEVSSFATEPEAPRNLFIDGVTNARDMGGWDCDGGKVKQGIVYRTARLHDDSVVNITEDGIKTMLDQLKVKTEIDLRSDVTPREIGVLGESVK